MKGKTASGVLPHNFILCQAAIVRSFFAVEDMSAPLIRAHK